MIRESDPPVALDLDTDWEFVRRRESRAWLGGAGRSPASERVDLPHCWNATDDFRVGVRYYRGHGSYRRAFDLPGPGECPGGRHWRLETEGFYGIGSVWLNGRRIAAVDGQYLGVTLDVEDAWLRRGRNLIGVRLTNRCPSHVLPGIDEPDFVLYGGLSGRVRLRAVPDLHFDPREVRIAARNPLAATVALDVAFLVRNRGERDGRCTARWQLVGPDGVTVSSDAVDLCVPARQSRCARLTLPVPAPALWSDRAPFLYRVRGELAQGHARLQGVESRFGFREAEFRPGQGFFLNGQRTELRGCNRHECWPGFGRAMAPWMHRFDARAMKDAGLNFVRLSHYPHHPAFLDACDDLGLLVYAEIATWKSVRGGRWLGSACRQMQDLVLRDRNRPCVIVWGMGNEGRHRVAYSRLRDVVRRLDPQRPVAYAENHLRRARRARTVGLPDVWGLNYELNALSEARRACALDNVIVTECSNRPLARRGDWLAQSDQVDGVERDLGVWRDAPWVAGFAVWSWNDYGTFRKKRYGRHCGIVDAWRQPKMAYAWLQARHAETPFLRVLGEWGGEAGRGDREIHVFTNCDRIRIRVAGKTVREAPGRTHIAERIPFEAGDLEVTGYRGDAQVSDRRSPYGPAQAVEIEPERCPADGPRDVASLTVCVVDARGRLVANWTGPVTLAVEGPGRIRFHDPAEPVRVVAGTGRGFVQGIGIPGLVTVTAGAPGLRDGLASVRFPETAGPVAEARIWVETPSGDRPK